MSRHSKKERKKAPRLGISRESLNPAMKFQNVPETGNATFAARVWPLCQNIGAKQASRNTLPRNIHASLPLRLIGRNKEVMLSFAKEWPTEVRMLGR